VCGVTRFFDLGHVGGSMASAIELTCGQRQQRIAARKQPGLRPRDAIPVAQQLEQLGREHRMAILAPFALLDPDHHALGVDVGYLQRCHLRHAQARAIGRSERRLVLRPRCCLQKAHHLLGAEDHGDLPRLGDKGQRPGDIGPVDRHVEEEAQRRHRGVDRRRPHAVLGQM